jgi:DNA-binding CsgD family transcriptional regulator
LRQSIDLDDGGSLPDGPPSFSSHLGAILAGIATATSSVFIGRSAELGRLSELLEKAEQGRRAVGVIAGDAGVGKTRLLGELAGRADARGIRVLVGGCMETGDVGLPYVPFVDAFRGLGGPPGEAELLSELVGVVPHLGRLLPTLGVPLRTAIESLSRRGRLGVGEPVEQSGTAAGLTARELEVLRLLAMGRSNQQIADALFISRKTASVHVSHILTKLEVGTRVEAAAVAHRLGLDESARPE